MKNSKDNLKIFAIIPARGGSKGIPKKNIINFCGKPLIRWSIMQARGSRYITDLYVTSDDQDILSISEKAGAKSIRRPKALATDFASTEGALLHALNEVRIRTGERIDMIVFLQATSPLRTSRDIDEAIKLFISEDADSLFSGSILEDFCIWEKAGGRFKSLTYDYKNRGRRQDRKPNYLENGSIYIFRPDILEKYNNRLGGRISLYPMPFWKSYEIDKKEDLEICEYFMKAKILKK